MHVVLLNFILWGNKMALINCPECEKAISNYSSSCPHCRFPMIRQPIVPITLPLEYKSRGVAILLSLLFGGIGAHKFYVDKPRSGILYLLFCWTFIPSIFGVIEAIQYGSMRNDDFQQRYKTKKL